jgi:hypothetical protein
MKPSRRRFLQAAGLGAGSLFLPSLWDRRKGAHAAPGDPPMRLIVCYHQHGVPHVNWDMHMGMSPTTRWEYGLGGLTEQELSACLRPLWRHRNKVTVVDGLSLATAIADPYGDGHAKGWVSSLTGGIARETIEDVKSNAAKPSLDQIIAKALRAQDPSLTDMVSIETGIYEYNFHAALYAELLPGQPVQRVPHEEQPQQLWDRLFPNGDGSTPPDPIKVAQPDVLASVAGMYDEMSARLSTEDRRKLEQHRDLIRDMENRLRRLAGLNCGAPVIQDYYWGEVPHPQRYDAHCNSFWDLMTVALSCGISRVASMQFGPLWVEQIGGTGDLHHDYAHPSSPDQVNDPLHPTAVTMMTTYTAKYADYIAQLADKLDAIPEGNGTMLDHTIILWVSELAHGGHGHDGWPAVIVGGGQKFRTGRYLHYEHDTLTTTTASWVDDNSTIGLPHNHLLVSVAQAMGVDVSVVGDATVRPKKPTAPAIDLSGPLPGLV